MHTPLQLYLSTLKSFLCSVFFTPPSTPACKAPVWLGQYNVCGWRDGVSVCPRGSSHTQLEEKGHTAWITAQPSSTQASLSRSLCLLGSCFAGQHCFSAHAEPQTHTGRWWEQRLLLGGLWGMLRLWEVFLPLWICSIENEEAECWEGSAILWRWL